MLHPSTIFLLNNSLYDHQLQGIQYYNIINDRSLKQNSKSVSHANIPFDKHLSTLDYYKLCLNVM